MPSIYLSAIFPAFNESQRILPTLQLALKYFNQKAFRYEIIVVDDGSEDGTVEVCQQAFADEQHIRLMRLRQNHGKGYAIKAGIEAARGEYILFADADNSTPIEEFDKFFPELSPATILIGSRFLRPELIERRQPWYRIAISRLANLVVRILLIKKVRDTQCGFKVFHRGIAAQLVQHQHIHRYGFDIEYLTIAMQNGAEIKEIPVRWINSPVSRIRPLRDSLGTLWDLCRITFNSWRGIYRN